MEEENAGRQRGGTLLAPWEGWWGLDREHTQTHRQPLCTQTSTRVCTHSLIRVHAASTHKPARIGLCAHTQIHTSSPTYIYTHEIISNNLYRVLLLQSALPSTLHIFAPFTTKPCEVGAS